MMSLAAINQLNQEIAEQAAEEGLVPYVPFNPAEVERCLPRIPNLGCLEPHGWDKTETSWFVDKTGVGLECEPALTIERFKEWLADYVVENPGHGFAITEEGPFQLYVSAFKPATE